MTLLALEHSLVNRILIDFRDKTAPAVRFRELGKQLTYFPNRSNPWAKYEDKKQKNSPRGL